MPAFAPIIVTADLPPDIFRWANAIRQHHHSGERPYIDAHVTLIRSLPPTAEGEVLRALAQMVRFRSPVAAEISQIKPVGGSLFAAIESAEMQEIRRDLVDLFHGLLTMQDQHDSPLHVTLANGLADKECKAAASAMNANFSARSFRFAGLNAHHFLGEGWKTIRSFSFR